MKEKEKRINDLKESIELGQKLLDKLIKDDHTYGSVMRATELVNRLREELKFLENKQGGTDIIST